MNVMRPQTGRNCCVTAQQMELMTALPNKGGIQRVPGQQILLGWVVSSPECPILQVPPPPPAPHLISSSSARALQGLRLVTSPDLVWGAQPIISSCLFPRGSSPSLASPHDASRGGTCSA